MVQSPPLRHRRYRWGVGRVFQSVGRRPVVAPGRVLGGRWFFVIVRLLPGGMSTVRGQALKEVLSLYRTTKALCLIFF